MALHCSPHLYDYHSCLGFYTTQSTWWCCRHVELYATLSSSHTYYACLETYVGIRQRPYPPSTGLAKSRLAADVNRCHRLWLITPRDRLRCVMQVHEPHLQSRNLFGSAMLPYDVKFVAGETVNEHKTWVTCHAASHSLLKEVNLCLSICHLLLTDCRQSLIFVLWVGQVAQADDLPL